MICIFVDETSDAKFKNYFGICCAVVNHTKYRQIKAGFQQILVGSDWDPAIEFKGSYLFSASKGCPQVPVEKRVDMAESIIRLNVSKKYGRMKFAYLRTSTDDVKADYLTYLPSLLNKVLSTPQKGFGKDLISFHCDYRNDISPSEVRNAINPLLKQKGYTLFENVIQVHSNFETVGILYADIVGYLMARIQTIKNDSELFDNIPPEMFHTSGKIKKLKSSVKLMKKIKNLDLYEVKLGG